MIPKLAIEKAIEGGWHSGDTENASYWVKQAEVFPAKITLDPAFWRGLGKALGWGGVCTCPPEVPVAWSHEAPCMFENTDSLFIAEMFCREVLREGDLEAFWDSYLPK